MANNPRELGFSNSGAAGAINLGELLPSQVLFCAAKQPLIAYAGGWGSGKTVALCLRMALIMAASPNNRGFIARLKSTDLRKSTLKVWEEVCPPSWVAHRNRTDNIYTFRNRSQVLFGHIDDPVAGRSHLASLNVAHIGIDQAEEVVEDDFRKLLGRTRYRTDLNHSVSLALNPAGHNWIWRRFFSNATVGHKHPMFPNLDWTFQKERSLGIAVPSDENKYLPKDYINTLRAEMPPEWSARYVDCSFDEFEGKVYPKYTFDSVHNIGPLAEFPSHWRFAVGIDVGGSAPWALLRCAQDEHGRVIVYDELYKPNLTIREVNDWIKADPHWPRAMIVIDPENRPVITELQNANPMLGIQPARKHKLANIARVNTHLQLNLSLPHLSGVTLPGGSPRLYITTNCTNTRQEHDQRLWKPDLHGRSVPDDRNDHTCDSLEYVLAMLAPSDPLPIADHLIPLAQADPGSAHFWRAVAKKEERARDTGNEMYDATAEDIGPMPHRYFEDEVPEQFYGGTE